MKYFNVRLPIRAKNIYVLFRQFDRWMTNGPMNGQKVKISFLLLHAINMSL